MKREAAACPALAKTRPTCSSESKSRHPKHSNEGGVLVVETSKSIFS